MPLYRVEVVEVRHVRMHYWVAADNQSGCKEKAEAGDTLREEKLKDEGVVDRTCVDDPEFGYEQVPNIDA